MSDSRAHFFRMNRRNNRGKMQSSGAADASTGGIFNSSFVSDDSVSISDSASEPTLLKVNKLDDPDTLQVHESSLNKSVPKQSRIFNDVKQRKCRCDQQSSHDSSQQCHCYNNNNNNITSSSDQNRSLNDSLRVNPLTGDKSVCDQGNNNHHPMEETSTAPVASVSGSDNGVSLSSEEEVAVIAHTRVSHVLFNSSGGDEKDTSNDPLKKYNHEILMRQMSSSSDSPKVELIWQNMSYEIRPSKSKRYFRMIKDSISPEVVADGEDSDSELDGSKGMNGGVGITSDMTPDKIIRKARKRTKILEEQNGMIAGGTLTALMGPSGAGKTTLLNCITGKVKKGRQGTTTIRLPSKKDCNFNVTIDSRDDKVSSASTKRVSRIRIGFVPQHDHLLPQFSVRESLMFASKMNNPPSLTRQQHDEKVEQLMIALKLTTVADQRVSKLSGGQLKRTSIGAELISSPEVLILDEPTSGLDADNSLNIVAILRSLCKSCSTAIIATIHQPSLEIFHSFHSIYLLSLTGANIYSGPPHLLAPYLASYGYDNVQGSTNPADYAVQVANGKFGLENLDKMAAQTRDNFDYDRSDTSMITLSVEQAESRQPMHSYFKQSYYLIGRVIQQNVTKTHDLLARTLLALILGAIICTMFVDPIGKIDGCWLDQLNKSANEGEEQAVKRRFFEAIAQQSPQSDQHGSLSEERDKLLGQLSGMVTNGIFVFIQALFTMISSTVGTVLTLPVEMQTVCKELSNSWYSVSIYFVARTIYDTAAVIIINTPAAMYLYWVTEQIPVIWRFCLFYSLGILFAQVCHSIGVLFGIGFGSNIMLAIVMATASLMPVAAFAGLVVPLDKMPVWMQPMAYVSHLKYLFEGDYH